MLETLIDKAADTGDADFFMSSSRPFTVWDLVVGLEGLMVRICYTYGGKSVNRIAMSFKEYHRAPVSARSALVCDIYDVTVIVASEMKIIIDQRAGIGIIRWLSG